MDGCRCLFEIFRLLYHVFEQHLVDNGHGFSVQKYNLNFTTDTHRVNCTNKAPMVCIFPCVYYIQQMSRDYGFRPLLRHFPSTNPRFNIYCCLCYLAIIRTHPLSDA